MNRKRARVIAGVAATLALVGAAAWLRGAEAPVPTLKDDFESPRTAWRQEQTDAPINLLEHERSERAAHDGRRAERFHFVAGPGSSFFYSYALPKVPVEAGLKASLYVRSSRPGVRLFGRVVLPADTDPETGQPSFVMVPGTVYDNVERWQRLELSNLIPSIERQARVLRASTRRAVSLDGAYLERLVVNLFGGAGETEAFLDELALAPVPPALLAEARAEPPLPAPSAAAAPRAEPRRGPQVQLDRNRLRRKGPDGYYRDWFFRAIHAPGANVALLRQAGFDVLAEGLDADPARLKAAVAQGFLLMPNLDATVEGAPIDADRMVASAQSYPFRESVAFWSLGDALGRSHDPLARKSELERIRAAIAGLRGLPGGVSPLTTALVAGELPLYTRAPRNLAVVGVRPNIWASANELNENYEFLKQRRELTVLSNPGGLFWCALPATAPPAVQAAIWGRDVPPPWGFPQVQADQIRLFTYAALSAGYRGIGFLGDADLTRDPGRMLLIEMALLNEELDLVETILAEGSDPIVLYNARFPDPPTIPPPGGQVNRRMPTKKEDEPHPSIRAAALNLPNRRGMLLVVTDLAGAAQYQPPQMAMNDVKITVPAPESAQAFDISAGEILALERERVPGGTRVSLPDFSTTALVLVTTDMALVEQIRAALERVRPMAVQKAIEQAQLKLQWVSETVGRLVTAGHRLYDETDPKTPKLLPGVPRPNDEGELIAKAEELIKSAREALEREDYPLAWAEARRVGRPLRHLMQAELLKAHAAMVKIVTPPDPNDEPKRLTSVREPEVKKPKKPVVFVPFTASPPLVSFNTLPQHYHWVDFMGKTFNRNLLPAGTFDDHESLETAGWINLSHQFDGVTAKVLTVPNPKDGRGRLLRMVVEPTDPKKLDTLAPFFNVPAAAIRTPPIPVTEGQFLRISVWYKKADLSPTGVGGIFISDSIGGETLQYRSSMGISDMSRVVLFRRAPARGTMTVTLGLGAFGEAFFDDLKVETIEDPSGVPATARRPPPGFRPSR